ncbi:MAG: ABC transporter ATP-binding protein [Desulfuromonadia bacterium]
MHTGGLYADEIGGKAYDGRLMLRFLRYLRPYRTLFLISLALLPFGTLTRLGQPWLIKQAIDTVISRGEASGLIPVSAGYLALVAAEGLFSFLDVMILQTLGQRIMHDVRRDLFSHLQRLSPSFFDRNRSGGIVTRVTSDVEALGEMFSAGIVTIIADILLLAGIIVTMVVMNGRLALVTFLVIPPLVGMTVTFRRSMRKAYRSVRGKMSALNSSLAETLTGMTVIRIFNRQSQERVRFRELDEAYRDANLPVITWDAGIYAGVEALSSVAVALIIWYGGGEIIRGGLTFGGLVAFIQYIEKFFSPIRDLSAKYSVMQGAMASLERIFNLLDTQERISDPPAPPPSPRRPGEGIVFHRVCFSYDGTTEVLSDLNLVIPPRHSVALVGETGGGKSTVTRLLNRLYDVTSGNVTLDGVDIREIPLASLRRRIGVVLQDPAIFSGSIRYNISLGDPDADGRVEEAARIVGAHLFIERLPDGYDTILSERGKNLSQGERQLISFARAIAFDPEILVLDEATASVDSESERLIQEGIRSLMRGRTTLIVAHRLSTIRECHRIVVIHRGRAVEEGTHDQLLAQGGVYSRLYRLQGG